MDGIPGMRGIPGMGGMPGMGELPGMGGVDQVNIYKEVVEEVIYS